MITGKDAFRYFFKKESKQRWSLRKRRSIERDPIRSRKVSIETGRRASIETNIDNVTCDAILKAPFYVRSPKFIGAPSFAIKEAGDESPLLGSQKSSQKETLELEVPGTGKSLIWLCFWEKVLFATKESTALPRIPVTGGSPISEGLANSLRTFAFGPAEIFIFNSGDYLETSFSFFEPCSSLAWALQIPKEGIKGLFMCVQSYFIKHLLFSRRRTKGSSDSKVLMAPEAKTQEDCLASALSDILWKAGDKQRVTLCLTQDASIVETTEFFRGDGVTEKIRLFHFKKQDELTFNIKKYLWQFVGDDKTGGAALFLYSLLLSKGFDRLKIDTEEEEPVAVLPNGTLHRCIATLMLTGKATPYLHNGVIYEGTEATMAVPKTGILIRSEIGFLIWNGPNREQVVDVGSRLKTPTFPVWLSLCRDSYGVLFNPNKDLMRDYHAENRFNLLYYSGNPSVDSVTSLTIDTREAKILDIFNTPPLELLIHTKWEDASVSWNGQEPYV